MISRRAALKLTAAGVLVLALPGCTPAHIALAQLVGEAVVPVGEAWLERHPEEADLDALLALLLGDDALPADATAHFSARTQADFRQGRIAELSGWLLSVTECRLSAVAALVAAAQAEERAEMFSGMSRGELHDRLTEVRRRYLAALRERAGLIALMGAAGLALGGLAQKRRAWLPPAVMTLALLAGAALAYQQCNLLDDAYVSFRYARNLVEGHGLVFNPGERVEGYTNFLWTVLIAALMVLTGQDAPPIALVLCALCAAGNALVVFAMGRRLFGGERPWLPLAGALLAVNHTATAFASSGLETAMAALWVSSGLWALIAGRTGLAGLALIAATLTRPDHALFYIAGAAVVGAQSLAARRWRAALAYAAPFALWLVVAGGRLAYYGSLVPNTWHVRSADQWYASQGLVYALSFYLGSHLWLIALLAGLFLLVRSRDPAIRALQGFVLCAAVLYNLYVVKVGGDFMYGRFYLSLLGVLLLGAEGLVWALWRRSPAAAVVATGLLLATARGVPLLEHNEIAFDIADEATIYEVSSVNPVVVDHMSYKVGRLLGAALTDRGIEPTIATCCIGMVAWYSRLPVIDLRGLTDATVAHLPIAARGRPGHEKWAEDDYILARRVHLARWFGHPSRFEELTRIRFVPRDVAPSRPWHIVHYDRAMMRRIAAEVPELAFTDFEAWLDAYIADPPGAAQVAADLVWFDRYYFDHNDDSARREALAAGAR